MMVAVAIVGTIAGILIERHARFSRLAAFHRSYLPGLRILEASGTGSPLDRLAWRDQDGKVVSTGEILHDYWRCLMASKYEYASRYPWLPVEPDPPEPEWPD
jgi:hypothetical protein